MRRRDRFANTVWLARFAGEVGGGQAADRCAGAPLRLEDCIDFLTSHGYYVDMEMVGAEYCVRCIPIREKQPIRLPPVALSYRGPDLSSVLDQAACDVMRLKRGEDSWELSVKERVRWVTR